MLQPLRFGCSCQAIADTTCSATTIRNRRDEWIRLGVFAELKQITLESYDRIVGLVLDQIAVDGCITKAPGDGEAAGRSPIDCGNKDPADAASELEVADRRGGEPSARQTQVLGDHAVVTLCDFPVSTAKRSGCTPGRQAVEAPGLSQWTLSPAGSSPCLRACGCGRRRDCTTMGSTYPRSEGWLRSRWTLREDNRHICGEALTSALRDEASRRWFTSST